MAVNDIITKNEYNAIRDKVIYVLGTGVSNAGYGQAVQSRAMTESDRITPNEWGQLRYDIINAYTHLYGSVPPVTAPVNGETIRFNASDAPVTYWGSIADTLVLNRGSVPPVSQRKSVNKGSLTYTGTWGYGASLDELVCYVTASWSSPEAARFFFNSGSYVAFSSTRSGGSTHSQNTSWTNLLAAAGSQGFGGAFPGAGTSPTDGANYFRSADVPITPWYTTSSTTPYGSNQYRIYASTPGVAVNSAGESGSVTFKVSYYDGHTPLGAGPDTVDGTFTCSVTTVEAYGALVPTGSGFFEVESPTITFLSFSPE